MTVEQVPMCQCPIPRARGFGCAPCRDVGLGYIKLGSNRPPPSPAARTSGSIGPRSCQNAATGNALILHVRAHTASASRRPQADDVMPAPGGQGNSDRLVI